MTKEPVTESFNKDKLAEYLTKARKKADLTRDEVVERATNGFARSSLQAWEAGEREPKLENIFELANIYNIHPWALLSGQFDSIEQVTENSPDREDEYAYIPAYDIEASAGHGSFVEGEKAHKHLAFRKKWLQARGLHTKDLTVLFTKGDSMQPTIADGAAIVIDKSNCKALDGKIYVLRIEDSLYVKRIQKIPSGLRLISDNKIYQPLDISSSEYNDEQFSICGQVIHVSYDLPD